MPSLPTLLQICSALSFSVGSLFEEPDVQLVPLESAPPINMGGLGVDERLVTPRSEGRLQLPHSTLEPHASGGEKLYTVNCEVESLHVVSGSVEVLLADRQVPLQAKDARTFPGSTPHTWHAGDRGAELIWVLAPAAWSGSS